LTHQWVKGHLHDSFQPKALSFRGNIHQPTFIECSRDAFLPFAFTFTKHEESHHFRERRRIMPKERFRTFVIAASLKSDRGLTFWFAHHPSGFSKVFWLRHILFCLVYSKIRNYCIHTAYDEAILPLFLQDERYFQSNGHLWEN
jgi:hypothetical protein